MNIFKLKSIREVLDNASKHSGLKKTLGVSDLLLLGLGAIIGTGIFVITGIAAVNNSGPAVTASYAIAGLTSIFIALAYAEIATMIPTAGGAYSYAFVAFGEIAAWIVAWMLILYLVLAAATVAAGWSGYMVSMLHEGGIDLSSKWTSIPSESGGMINLPALLIVVAVTLMLVKGTKESVILNTVLVITKIIAIAIFIWVAAPHFDAMHWLEHNHPVLSDSFMGSNFMPFGLNGVLAGAALVFFAYNGFDSLASAAEECKNPERDLTIAIPGSLIICTILYMVVAGLLVGIIPFNLIDIKSPLASALSSHGHNATAVIIAAGVVIGMISVLLMQIFAVSRIILVVARDGLLPPFLAKIHPKFQTPYVATLILGGIIACITGFVPLNVLGSLSSVGALFSFMVVCMAVITLRYRYPDMKRPFKCPMIKIVAGLGILLCLTLLTSAMQEVGIYAVSWLVVGIVVYFAYARFRVQ